MDVSDRYEALKTVIATSKRTKTMTARFAHQTSRLLLTSATMFCALATVATLCAQGPGREPDGGPVRQELDEFREKSSKKRRRSVFRLSAGH